MLILIFRFLIFVHALFIVPTKLNLKKLLFSLFTLACLLLLLELILGLFFSFPKQHLVATPNSGFIWERDSGLIDGLNRQSNISFDELGSRSISDYRNKSKKILAIGGSTTACYA